MYPRWLKYALMGLAVGALVVLLIFLTHVGVEFLLHWLAVHTGTINETGPYYGFWSGFGSDLGELTIFAAVIGIYKKHNCHERGCWRLAKFDVTGTPYKVCRKHHPTIPDKAIKGEIKRAHAKLHRSGERQ